MHNEKEYIRKTIIDDGGNDGSENITDEIQREDSSITVIHHTVNTNFSGAVKTGFLNAQKEIILYTDMDLSFDLAELKST